VATLDVDDIDDDVFDLEACCCVDVGVERDDKVVVPVTVTVAVGAVEVNEESLFGLDDNDPNIDTSHFYCW
jgi:hypothetical protein